MNRPAVPVVDQPQPDVGAKLRIAAIDLPIAESLTHPVMLPALGRKRIRVVAVGVSVVRTTVSGGSQVKISGRVDRWPASSF